MISGTGRFHPESRDRHTREETTVLSRRTAVIASAASLVAAAPALAADATDQQLIRRAFRDFNTAFGNAPAVARLYLANAVLAPPTHEIIRGRAAIEQFWAAAFAAGLHGHALDLVTFRSDAHTVVAIAKWSARGKGGARFGGTATLVYARQAGGLAIWEHTWN
jgi:ketosteroid isomerase-like protein